MKKLSAYSLDGEDEERLRKLLERRGYCAFQNGAVVQNNPDTPGKFIAMIYYHPLFHQSCIVLHEKDSKLKKLLEDFKR